VRRAAYLGALLSALAAPAAHAAPHRSTLRLAAITGVPASAQPDARFVVRGRVTARHARARRVRVSVTLRSAGTTRTIGARVLRRLAVARARRFRIDALIPARGLGEGTFTARICARSARAVSGPCRRRDLTIVPGPETGSPSPSPTATRTPPPGVSPTPTPTTVPPGAGAESAGDRLLPNLGNGGYDALSYDLALSYTPAPGPLRTLGGTATMTARATQDLGRFSLDLEGFTVSAVTVDGAPAAFERHDTPDQGAVPGAHKLRVTPPAPIAGGSTFAVVVSYSGTPPTITDPDGSGEGFLPTGDGAFVAGEPMGSMGWFPNDDHPSDKATFKLSLTVPLALTAVGNGILVSSATSGTTRTWVWQETHPMATYLATATLGTFAVTESDHAGLHYYDAIDPSAGPSSGQADEPAVIALYTSKYGPYPFSVAGGIVDNAPTVGYSLETQTKPIYPLGPVADDATVAHELAHQWFGDSLSPQRWEDIWLNEGFAEFSSWLFVQSTGGATTQSHYDDLYAQNAAGAGFWKVPPAAPPTAADLFDQDAMYNRGAMTLEALREIVGDAPFYDILKTWATDHAYGNVTTSEFVDLVKAKSGRDPARIQAFFGDWLYDADKPAITPAAF
jgi:hypothetical protein